MELELWGYAATWDEPTTWLDNVPPGEPPRCRIGVRSITLAPPIPLLMDHDWDQQLGRVYWSKDDRCGLRVAAWCEPGVRRLLGPGGRNEMSIGFATGSRYVETGDSWPRMVEGRALEVSLVRVGACPGTGVVGWRLLA